MSDRIYLDYNATTPVCAGAAEAMRRAMTELWGNPSSVHAEGQSARAAVERARGQVAALIGTRPREIVFTSGATESINWVHRVLTGPGTVITTAVEHPATLGACRRRRDDLGDRGPFVEVGVDDRGHLDPGELERILKTTRDVPLVSVMLANNEIGTVYPLRLIADLCHAYGVPVHSDITQAVAKIPVSLGHLGVDLASVSAHKIYGPKGVGALWIRTPETAATLLAGGHQERGRRPGTENLVGIIGFGAAAEAATRGDLTAEAERQRQLSDRLLEGLRARIDRLVVNSDPPTGLPNTLNVSFLGCDAEGLLMALDLEGVSVSAGSACSAGSLEPSHVLLALTPDRERHRSAVRFSLGRPTTAEQIDEAAERVAHCVHRLRSVARDQVERR